MKKLLAAITPAITLLTLAPSAFAAVTTINTCPTGTFLNLCSFTFGGNFISALITTLFIIAIIIALVYLIWGGIKWIMSGGDKQNLQTAREHVIAAIIGLVIVFITYFIVNFVLNIFLGVNAGNFTLPSFR